MGKNFSGLTKVAHADTAGGAQTDVPGKVSVDSTIEADNIKTETPFGSAYGGSLVRSEIMFLDDSGFDTIEGFMTADTEKFWFFHFKDGRVLRTAEAVNPFARLGAGVNARDGLVAWIMDFEQHSNIPMLVVN